MTPGPNLLYGTLFLAPRKQLFIRVSNDGFHAVITVHVILVSVRWAEKSGHDAAEYLLIKFQQFISTAEVKGKIVIIVSRRSAGPVLPLISF